MDSERLLGKIEEQGLWLKDRLERLESKVDKVIAFKWQIIGGSVTLSFLATLIVEMFRIKGE